ncbi:YhcN/YlaJ family sporulation lipoprotein [Bacillus sp. DX4.1]|uniref:YhcN/YlaJ family sporulation lipoprotein n=1 Tax=Bacillus sp. DX4.1 TaxID=3055867 RepID=UPI0025A2ED49|nr:YhcN/YlaJ family sporulation lipoprotein [Bacillus sp. DX4.1]MDM5190715.1 YhcN/YlaJ family sporulation lipoprotein [Bacillus sp. DX4.1]
MRKLGTITVLFVLLLNLITGCTSSPLDKKVKKEADKKSEQKKDSQLKKVSAESINQSIANDAKHKILSMEGLLDARAVNSNTDLYLAAKPEHHERFKLKALRNKMKKQLQSAYPHLDIHISTDRKIFTLLDKLEKKIKKKEIDKEQLKKQLKTIQSEMKSDT